MDQYLNSYMETLSTRQREKVSTLIEEVKLTKEALSSISDVLSKDIEIIGGILISSEQENGQISSGTSYTNMREIRREISELFDFSNSISQLLENSSMILSSQIDGLEDDLLAMEKVINEHAITQGVGGVGANNFSYFDTFSDDLGREPMAECPDRGGLRFGSSEMASIDLGEGALTLPKTQTIQHGVTRRVVKSNFTTNDAQVDRSTKDWRLVVDTESPITSNIHEAAGYTGAQAVVEYKLSAAAPVSEISINPYSDTVMTLLSVKAFRTPSDTNGFEVLTSPVVLDQPKTLYFPMQAIYRIEVTVNQPTYDRVSIMHSAEDEYRKAHEGLRQRLNDIKNKFDYNMEGGFNHLLFVMLKYLSADDASSFSAPTSMPKMYEGPAGVKALYSAIKKAGQPNGSKGLFDEDKISFALTEFIKTAFSKKDDLYNMLASKEVAKFESLLQDRGILDPNGELSPIEMIYKDGWVYRYSLGIQNVAMRASAVGFKGFHVTKQLDSDGDVGEVSIQVQEFHFRDKTHGLDNSLLTSTEYSVSNTSDPKEESNWIPILPIGTQTVESERLLPDTAGKCMFRFPAHREEMIEFYINGTIIDIPSVNHIYDNMNKTIIGIRVPIERFKPEDILTVTYTPFSDHTSINFSNYGFGSAPLISASDNIGSGEGYDGLIGRTVQLKHNPWIDYVQASKSEYVEFIGMRDFNPITIRMGDGSTAINLTDYISGTMPYLPSISTYYIQNGDVITFNREISEPFRVFYQYLQNNLRVRTVLRCNSANLVSPMVSSLYVQGKTRRPNNKGVL